MYYIVGFKKKIMDAKKSGTSTTGTATVAEIAGVDLYLTEVKRVDGEKDTDIPMSAAKKYPQINYGPPGSATYIPGDISGKPKFLLSRSLYVGTIVLNKSLKDLDKKAQAAMKKIDANVPKLMNAMNVFGRKTKEYLSGGNVTDMENAADGYVNLFELINEVFGGEAAAAQSGVKGGVEVDAAKTGIKRRKTSALQENKNNFDNILDKLIKEVILNR